MIQIICKSESYTYNAYHILKAFYPSQEVSCKTDEKASNYVMVHLPDDREISVGFENTVEITDTAGRDESTGKIQEDSEKESQKKERKRQIDLSLYDQLERITGEPLAWGVLTGVRPTKLAMQKLEAGWEKEDYINWAWESARVRGEKAALAWEIAEREQKILKELDTRTDIACMLESRSVHRSVLTVLSVPDHWIAGKKKWMHMWMHFAKSWNLSQNARKTKN